MMTWKRSLVILLCLTLLLALPACGRRGGATGSDLTPETSAPATGKPAATTSDLPSVTAQPTTASSLTPATEGPTADAVDGELPVRVMVLNGTTGFGMANLIWETQQGQAALNYSFSVETDASNVTAALVNGSADIAALPTNAAAALYNKTGGAIQVVALNTLGVLYLLSNGTETVQSLADLEGKTVYAPAQNPSFILQRICDGAGVNVTIDNSYAQPAELNAAVSAGTVALAVLPEPMVTIARSQNPDLTVALDLNEAWEESAPAGSLVQGCAVVRREFAEAHPAELAQFLEDYRASLESLQSDPETGAQHIEETGVFAKAAVALKALPNCNLCFLVGEEMRSRLSGYLSLIYETAPASVGGALPAGDFYYIP